ncbi:rod-binding protein [Sphingomonas sp. FW199]|uniref:rod-binding protein n=1 Tax=Sphingomonas sp. FW199 TaxID=3400217 RepID=UPI003CE8E8F8
MNPLSAPAPAASSAGVSIDTSRLSSRDNLNKAGQQFESLFVGMMLASMRKANLAKPLFDSQAMTQFRDMQDQQLAKTMAASTPLGIGRAMTDFLSRSQPTLAEPPGAAMAPDAKE